MGSKCCANYLEKLDKYNSNEMGNGILNSDWKYMQQALNSIIKIQRAYRTYVKLKALKKSRENDTVMDGILTKKQTFSVKFINTNLPKKVKKYPNQKAKGLDIGEIQWNNGSKYIGSILNNDAHGEGILYNEDKSYFQGLFVHNEACGNGKYVFPNKMEIYGSWKNNVLNGIGTEKGSDGSIYEGPYINNKKNGNGKFIWNDGSVYEGTFVNDDMTGKGTLIWKNGNKYTGDFNMSKMSGDGKFTWLDGRIYEGI